MSLLVLGAVQQVGAFSLLGPYESWQIEGIGFNLHENLDDLGGPRQASVSPVPSAGGEFRWNLPVITYGFDRSFTEFFGQKGIEEVKKALAVFSSLPRFSKMSSNLTEYPLDTRRANYRAASLGLLDLKSTVMGLLIEQFGLANADRFTWNIRSKVAIPGGFDYYVLLRNYDPATALPSRTVNGTLYSYVVLDPVPGFITAFADAVELSVDPMATGPTAVASIVSQIPGQMTLASGRFFTGLTRDDVGGLRYIYNKNNRNIEDIPNGSVGSGFGLGGAWSPVTVTNISNGTTNVTTTNAVTAVRSGIDRFVFKQMKVDRTGAFIPMVVRYTDTATISSGTVQQTVVRELTRPDILFTAQELGPDTTIAVRSSYFGTTNAAGTNVVGVTTGIVQPPVDIVLNSVDPTMMNYYANNSFFLEEGDAFPNLMWGTFDASTNAPFVYPFNNGAGYPIDQLESGY